MGTQLTQPCSSRAFEEFDSFSKANTPLLLSAIFYFVCKRNASPVRAGHWAPGETPRVPPPPPSLALWSMDGVSLAAPTEAEPCTAALFLIRKAKGEPCKFMSVPRTRNLSHSHH